MTKHLLLHGPFEKLSSFSIVNRQLAAGLRALGYRVTVMPSDGTRAIGPRVRDPDIYFAHGHPYDVVNAPGKRNVFLLNYEYARILKRDEILVERLNHFFDLVFVPSSFVREVCEASGIRIPVLVTPYGVEHTEFHPGAPPVELPTQKRFRFLYLGGANERKGTDILLDAFAEEFTAQDDVTLILKTFGYEHLRAEFERKLAKQKNRRNAPEILHVDGQAGSVAGYYTAAEWGVFPFRGEGFGLPILECIACGRPVLVTEGTAPLDFCNAGNAVFIPAARVTRHGKEQLEPERAALRRLLRAAYEGRLRRTSAQRSPQEVSRSVREWAWERTVRLMHEAMERHAAPARVSVSDSPARVGYAFYQKGVTSWKKVAQVVDRTLARRFHYVPLNFHAVAPQEKLKVLVGDSGFALEHFVRAARLNPKVKRILLRGNGPFETSVAIEDRERALCGVPPRRHEPMEFWRNRRECELADQIIVFGRASRELFLRAGYAAGKVHTLALGVVTQARPMTRRKRKVRFLFLATSPFRKGIRILFQAWDALQLKDAELVCIANTEALNSPLLLRYLVRNPNIIFKPLVPRRELDEAYRDCDVQVLPSFEDGFPFAIAEGMGFGKPAILTRAVGLSDLIAHLENGYLVRTGSVEQMKNALAYFCENRHKIPTVGRAAFETAREHSWARFERELAEIVEAQMQ